MGNPIVWVDACAFIQKKVRAGIGWGSRTKQQWGEGRRRRRDKRDICCFDFVFPLPISIFVSWTFIILFLSFCFIMSRNALLMPSQVFMPAQQHHYQAAFPPRHCPPSPPSTATSSPLHNAPSLQKEHTKSSWHHHHHPSSSATPFASRTMTNATTSNDDTSTFLNLERVVRQYSEQPELLGLILSSKVEEDRRRTEEARLKQKEIDYLLQQHQQHDGEPQQRSDTYRSNSNWQSAGYTQGGEKRHDENKLQNSSTHRRSSISWQQQPNTTSVYQDSTSYPNEMTTMAAESSTLPRIHTPPQHHHHHHTPTRRNSAVRHSAGTSWRHEPYPSRHDTTTTIRRRSSSNIDMLLSHSPRLSRSSLPPISTSPPPNTLSKEPQSKR